MDYLKKLQNKPYEERIRILKIAAVITGLIIIGVWVLTLKARQRESVDTSRFQKLWNNVRELKSKF